MTAREKTSDNVENDVVALEESGLDDLADFDCGSSRAQSGIVLEIEATDPLQLDAEDL